eukprot:TRINITY_DN123100_c0_g1_i1.p1 TRINITY_DN123100_c0_g1~~TRINITY_DN123100_c0_g1_i1.p1  ORF type:complete len:185 (-),score=28.47 TRINITY_DN123100_c0_g1_i1:97-651(-)
MSLLLRLLCVATPLAFALPLRHIGTPSSSFLAVDTFKKNGTAAKVNVTNASRVTSSGNVSGKQSKSNFTARMNASAFALMRQHEAKGACGANRLEVGKDLMASVQMESVHVDYLCECLETSVVPGPYIGGMGMRAQVGSTGPKQEFNTGSAKSRLCAAINWMSMFVNEDTCQYWVSPEDMKDMC